jgi:hypothetical protein
MISAGDQCHQTSVRGSPVKGKTPYTEGNTGSLGTRRAILCGTYLYHDMVFTPIVRKAKRATVLCGSIHLKH